MRPYHSMKRVALSSLLIVIATVALVSGTAAEPPVEHCDIGNVESAFQAWVPGGRLWRELGLDEGGLAEGVMFCQYRLFREAEVCFCEDDIFLGGSTWYSDDPSQSEAREWLAQIEVEVFLTPEGGETSELDVISTAIKGGQHFLWGQLVYQQHGVFLQLPPGEYLTTYRDCHPDFGDCGPGGDGWWEVNVPVRVLPHDVAHDLGPPSTGGFGSVPCPQD